MSLGRRTAGTPTGSRRLHSGLAAAGGSGSPALTSAERCFAEIGLGANDGYVTIFDVNEGFDYANGGPVPYVFDFFTAAPNFHPITAIAVNPLGDKVFVGDETAKTVQVWNLETPHAAVSSPLL